MEKDEPREYSDLENYLYGEANSAVGGILKELQEKGLIRNNADAFKAAKHYISDGVHGMRRRILEKMGAKDGERKEGIVI